VLLLMHIKYLFLDNLCAEYSTYVTVNLVIKRNVCNLSGFRGIFTAAGSVYFQIFLGEQQCQLLFTLYGIVPGFCHTCLNDVESYGAVFLKAYFAHRSN